MVAKRIGKILLGIFAAFLVLIVGYVAYVFSMIVVVFGQGARFSITELMILQSLTRKIRRQSRYRKGKPIGL